MNGLYDLFERTTKELRVPPADNYHLKRSKDKLAELERRTQEIQREIEPIQKKY